MFLHPAHLAGTPGSWPHVEHGCLHRDCEPRFEGLPSLSSSPARRDSAGPGSRGSVTQISAGWLVSELHTVGKESMCYQGGERTKDEQLFDTGCSHFLVNPFLLRTFRKFLPSPVLSVPQARCLIRCVHVNVKVPDGRHAGKGRNCNQLDTCQTLLRARPVPHAQEQGGRRGVAYPTLRWGRGEALVGRQYLPVKDSY